MPKKSFQDMIKIKYVEKEPLKSKSKENISKLKDLESSVRPKKIKSAPISPVVDSKKTYKGLWLIAVFCIIGLFFVISFIFAKASVAIIPKIKDAVINTSITASTSDKDGNITYKLVTLSGEEKKSVISTEEKDVSINAHGQIFIYNASSSPQTLSINTKLIGSNNKIYLTNKKIVIPSATKDGNPGKTEVGIVAEFAGSEYNSTPIDFKISGFKNTPKYSKFYGRSKGDIEGGFVGKLREVSELDKTSTVGELKALLKKKLLKQATDSLPEGFLLYPDAHTLSYDEAKFDPAEASNEVTVSLRATFNGILLKEDQLTKKILANIIPQEAEEDIYISNVRGLTFTLADLTTPISETAEINFTLSGNSKFIWRVNSEEFKKELLGKNKKEFNQILSNYKNIDSAVLVIKPLWKTSFPDNPKDIDITVNYPQ